MVTVRSLLLMAAISGGLAVMVGAFGAHGLKSMLSVDAMATFKTGVQYHFYHTLALLLCGCIFRERPMPPAAALAGISFALGIVLFSGSLYLLALSGFTLLGLLTPLGGLCFIAGWTLLAAAVLRDVN